jgi:shikimate dehydrogenase
MAALPDYSIVINATGMGKDSPGSPITDAGVFRAAASPGSLTIAASWTSCTRRCGRWTSANLRVEDGWIYFVHGWSQVVAQVLHVEITPDLFRQLDEAAATTK